MRAIALFSGGKDGLYSIYLAENMGYDVAYLLALKTTIGISPHYENLPSLRRIANAMGKAMITFDMVRGREELVELLKALSVEAIVAGDVKIEDHYRWLEGIAREAGIELVEPIFGRNTLELAREILRSGFSYSIIAVEKGKVSEEYLGYTFEGEGDLLKFLDDNPGVDPLGEFGEFHTVVLSSPLYSRRFKLVKEKVLEDERYRWLKFRLVEEG
ncbi:ATP pyrophosphatase [Pyrococcus sp. ST04]|uniref:PAB0415 family putative ATP pyrophosphatase n=1 Tax=Pyrococcus sp. ST04 TaxID=1183377 RepID=UPI0002605A72|nr:ATP pyrophosphatase [Pyrococcus sp. ST04]AFK22051.1 hypothetical protein Py04_0449 [Pyrococcus sp. ST04]